MGSLKVYANGTTFGTPGRVPPPGGRKASQGWSARSAAANRQFLYGVETDALDGIGYAITLTLLECPATADDFHRLRTAFIKRVRRAEDLVRYHWVIEFQRRGVPHLHLALYVRRGQDVPDVGMLVEGGRADLLRGIRLLALWVDVVRSAGFTASSSSQDVKLIDGPVGWLQYLSKHASRSAAHYQREGMPGGWERSGRLWGHGGSWPTSEPVEVSLSPGGMVRYRRLVRAYVLAEARRVGDWRRVAYFRRRPARERSPWRSRILGGSEWVPEGVALSLALLAAGVGAQSEDGIPISRAVHGAAVR